MTIPLQSAILYGPMNSRRFGKSLGINLLPNGQKLCNFDCVYCQYGQSPLAHKMAFPSVEEIEAEMGEYLRNIQPGKEEINWIMIAGNGEPTLHPNFPQVVERLISVRNELAPQVPIGILSNSSTCHRPEIQSALSRLGGRYMKLDAGTADAFSQINQPAGSVQWSDIVAGLYRLRNVILQSLFFTGSSQNVAEDLVEGWIKAVGYIRPEAVQIYTLDRPPGQPSLLAAPKEILLKISSRLSEKTGIASTVF